MASTRQINSSTEANAHESGAPFDDIANIKDLQKATIHRIVLTCDTFIRSIAVGLRSSDTGLTWSMLISILDPLRGWS